MNNYKLLCECWDKTLKEGFRIKNYFTDGTGGNLARENANTQKIIERYPTRQDLIVALKKLCQDPRANDSCIVKFTEAMDELSDERYNNPEMYREFVRKNLSGASGFWKHVAYYLVNGSTAGLWNLFYNIYKVNRIKGQIDNQDADDAMLAMNRRTFFR